MGARRPAVTLTATTFFSALLLACGSPAGPPATPSAEASPPPSSSTAAPPSTVPADASASPGPPSQGSPGPASPASSGPASADPLPSDWRTFTTSDGGLSFDLPSAWRVQDPAGETPLGGVFVEVLNAGGKRMATLRTNIVTGSECTQLYPYLLFDSEPMQALAEPGAADAVVPRYVFEGRGDSTAPEPSQSTVAAYGITMTPEESGPTACPMFQLFLWPPSGAMFGATYNPGTNATPGDPSMPYLEKAKLYASTAEYQQIRKMITSLRAAET
jgi:hypothetical protein